MNPQGFVDTVRHNFIVGNWKMHTTAAESRSARAARTSAISRTTWGSGAYKDQVIDDEASVVEMLRDAGAAWVILGHSERRHKLGESDAFINQKVRVALTAGLDVILCVGETSDQRKANQTEAVLDRQLVQGLVDVPAEVLTRVTIAYEPVWAIGASGHEATPQQVQDAHSLIRRRFARMYGEKSAQAVVIQYGGSVKPENAASMLTANGVDGALIGGASLHADQFLAIVRAGIVEAQTKGKSA